METSRIISDRYLLQRMIKQGQICTIYQGTDQRLQRSVAIKVIPATYMHVYKAAVRLTAQFSHPNIVGLYDIISEPETLYLVQEYVEGNDFAILLNMQLTPYEVADLGSQLCQALLYAYLHPMRRVSHGDLTPTAIMRDRKGVVHINNFALPSDISYFTRWNSLGGTSNDGNIVADRELPWGQYSDGRQADDTRAVGLLLYQLLASRPNGALVVEPPQDGRLHFSATRNIPPELCELVARAVVRQHPQHISTAEVLYYELRSLADALEPAPPVEIAGTYAQEPLKPRQFYPPTASEKLVTPLAARENAPIGVAAYHENNPNLTALEPALTVADGSVKLATAQQAAYHEMMEPHASHRLPLTALIVLCLVIFALFFIVGYFGGHLLFPQ